MEGADEHATARSQAEQTRLAARPMIPSPAFSYRLPGTGCPAPGPPWRYRFGLIIGIAFMLLLALVVFGAVLRLLVTPSSQGTITFPGTLLGLSQDTGPAAQAIDRQLRREVAAVDQGKVPRPVAAVYGSPPGSALFIPPGTGLYIAGGGICAGCGPQSAAAAQRSVPGSQTFPPGPNGGLLLCAARRAKVPYWFCEWIDQTTTGSVAYYGRSASSISDAAAKTNQIRAAIGH